MTAESTWAAKLLAESLDWVANRRRPSFRLGRGELEQAVDFHSAESVAKIVSKEVVRCGNVDEDDVFVAFVRDGGRSVSEYFRWGEELHSGLTCARKSAASCFQTQLMEIEQAFDEALPRALRLHPFEENNRLVGLPCGVKDM